MEEPVLHLMQVKILSRPAIDWIKNILHQFNKLQKIFLLLEIHNNQLDRQSKNVNKFIIYKKKKKLFILLYLETMV